MSITVKPMHPDFVTEISGVDLARPLKLADRDAIEDAINRYAIVVFHDQTLTDEQQIDFARHFGPIHSSAQKARHTGIKHRIASNDIADISNLDGDGNVLAPNNKRRPSGLRTPVTAAPPSCSASLWETRRDWRTGYMPQTSVTATAMAVTRSRILVSLCRLKASGIPKLGSSE